MTIYKKVVQKMSKYILGYSTGSIIGRTVYKPQKSIATSVKTSIFGRKVYIRQENERDNLCCKLLKKFRKR